MPPPQEFSLIDLGDDWEEVFGVVLLLRAEEHQTHLGVDHLTLLRTNLFTFTYFDLCFDCSRQIDDITHVPAQIL